MRGVDVELVVHALVDGAGLPEGVGNVRLAVGAGVFAGNEHVLGAMNPDCLEGEGTEAHVEVAHPGGAFSDDVIDDDEGSGAGGSGDSGVEGFDQGKPCIIDGFGNGLSGTAADGQKAVDGEDHDGEEAMLAKGMRQTGFAGTGGSV